MTVIGGNNHSQDDKTAEGGYIEESPQRIGIWGWLGLYLTGAVLLFLLLAHILLVHYGSSQQVSFQRTLSSLQSPFVRFVELGLLLIAFIHGFTGLRRILLDLEIFQKRGNVLLTTGFVVTGCVFSIWGVFIFSAFLRP